MVLKETTGLQSIYITPKSNAVTSIDLLCQETNVTVNYPVTEVFTKSYYIRFDLVVALVEGRSYTLKAKTASGEVVFYGFVYCTNQTISDYTINKDEYVQRNTTNEYIVYGD